MYTGSHFLGNFYWREFHLFSLKWWEIWFFTLKMGDRLIHEVDLYLSKYGSHFCTQLPLFLGGWFLLESLCATPPYFPYLFNITLILPLIVCSVPFRALIPTISLKVTLSPVWKPCIRLSKVVTTPGFACRRRKIWKNEINNASKHPCDGQRSSLVVVTGAHKRP